jgi:hypothetical protein
MVGDSVQVVQKLLKAEPCGNCEVTGGVLVKEEAARPLISQASTQEAATSRREGAATYWASTLRRLTVHHGRDPTVPPAHRTNYLCTTSGVAPETQQEAQEPCSDSDDHGGGSVSVSGFHRRVCCPAKGEIALQGRERVHALFTLQMHEYQKEMLLGVT